MVGGIQMQRYNFHKQHSVVTITYRNRGKKLEESERSNNKQMVILITLLDQYTSCLYSNVKLFPVITT